MILRKAIIMIIIISTIILLDAVIINQHIDNKDLLSMNQHDFSITYILSTTFLIHNNNIYYVLCSLLSSLIECIPSE